MKLVIGLAVIFVCIITYAFLDAAKKADKMMIHRIEKFNVLHVEIFPNSVTGS